MHRKERAFYEQSRKKTSDFNSEAEERAFWEVHDSSEYVDWRQATPAIFPNLKPSTRTLSLLPCLPAPARSAAGSHQGGGQQAGHALPAPDQGMAGRACREKPAAQLALPAPARIRSDQIRSKIPFPGNSAALRWSREYHPVPGACCLFSRRPAARGPSSGSAP